jgi:anti-sigma factor RsiW
MRNCDECSLEILLYLDNVLTGRKLEDLRAHLAVCSGCRERLEEERALSSLLRETRPLYFAPQALRGRIVAAATEQITGLSLASVGSRKTRTQDLTRWLLGLSRPALRWKPLAAMTLVLVLGLVLIPDAVERVRASEYVKAATQIHRSYLEGALPLQCRSRFPEVITAWLADKTPFHFQLPASQSVPNSKPVYWLTGARLVNYKGSAAALVGYETRTEKISLLVTSSKSAIVAGGEEVRSGDLTFHYRTDANSQVITWTNHGLTYALVSSLADSPQHSCLVCHQDMADQNLFKH